MGFPYGPNSTEHNDIFDIIKYKFTLQNGLSKVEQNIIKYSKRYSSSDISKFISLYNDNYPVSSIFNELGFPIKPKIELLNEILSSFSGQDASDIIIFGSLNQGLAWMADENKTAKFIIPLFMIFKKILKSSYKSHVKSVFTLVLNEYLLHQSLGISDEFVGAVLSIISECKDLTADFSDIFLSFLYNTLDSELDKSISLALTVSKHFILENRPFFPFGNGSPIFKCITPLVEKLNPTAIELICTASISNDEIIEDISEFFRLMAESVNKIILNEDPFIKNQISNLPKVCEFSAITFEPSFEGQERIINAFDDIDPVSNSENVNNNNFSYHFSYNEEVLNSVILDVNNANTSINSIIPPYLSEFLQMIPKTFNSVDHEYIRLFMKEIIVCANEHQFSPSYTDFYSVILFLLESFHENVPVSDYIDFILSPIIFNVTIENAFVISDSSCSLVRLITLILILDYNQTNVNNLLIFTAKISPVAYSEIILFMLTYIFKINDICDLCHEESFHALIYSIYKIQKMYMKTKNEKYIIPRTILMKFVFLLIKNQKSFQISASSLCLSNGIANFIFEPHLTTLIFDMLTKAFSECNNSVTNPTYFRIISLFSTILDSCSMNIQDSRYKKMGNMIIDCVSTALFRNSDLILSFYSIFNSFIKYILNDPNPSYIIKCSAFLSSISKQVSTFKFTPEMFRNFAEIIQKVEGNEPSDKFLLGLYGLMSGENITLKSSLFLIKFPNYLPIILVSFSQSEKFVEILEFFYHICNYSPVNCNACHKGDLDYFLVHFLRKEMEFTYHFYDVSFKFDLEKTIPLILKIIRQIIKVKTSVSICDQLIQMTIPTSSNYQMDIAPKILSILLEVISEDINRMRPIFDLITNKTICQISGINSKYVNIDFALSFWIKVDIPQISKLSDNYTIALIESSDKTSKFKVFIEKNNLVGYFSNSELTISTSFIENIPSNEWIYITLEKINTGNDKIIKISKNSDYIKEIELNNYQFPPGDVLLTFGTSSDDTNSHITIGELGPFSFFNPIFMKNILNDYSYEVDPNMETFKDAYFNSASIIDSKLHNQFDFSVNKQFRNSQNINDILVEYYDLNYLTYIYSKFRPEDSKLSMRFLEIILLSLSSSIPAQEKYKSIPLLTKTISKLHKGQLTSSLYTKLFKYYTNLKYEFLVKEYFDYIILNMELWGLADLNSIIKIIQHWSIYAKDYFKPIVLKSCNISRLLSMLDILFFSKSKTVQVTEDSIGIQTTESIEEQKPVHSFHANHSNQEAKKCKEAFVQFIISMAQISFNSHDVYAIYSHLFASRNIRKTVELLKLVTALGKNILCVKKLNFDLLSPLLAFFNLNSDEIIIHTIFTFCSIAKEKVHLYLSIASIHIEMKEDFSQIFKILVTKIFDYPNLYSLICALSLRLDQTEIDAAVGILQAINDSSFTLEISHDNLWALWPICIALRSKASHRKVVAEFLAQQIIQFSFFVPKFVEIYSLIFFLANDSISDAFYLQSDLTLCLANHVFKSKKVEIEQQMNHFMLTAFSSIFFFHRYFRSQALYKEIKKSPFPFHYVRRKKKIPASSLPTYKALFQKAISFYDNAKTDNESSSESFRRSLPIGESSTLGPYTQFVNLMKFIRPPSITNKKLVFQLRIAESGDWVDAKLCEKLFAYIPKIPDPDYSYALYEEAYKFLNDHNTDPSERDISSIDLVILELQDNAVLLDHSSMFDSLAKSCEDAKIIISQSMKEFNSKIKSISHNDLARELNKLNDMQNEIKKNVSLIQKEYIQCRDSTLFINRDNKIIYKRDNCTCFDFCPFKVRPEFRNSKYEMKIWEYKTEQNPNNNKSDIITQTDPIDNTARRSSAEFKQVVDCTIVKVSHNASAKFLLSEKQMIIFKRRTHKVIDIKPYTILNILKRKMLQKDTAIEIFLTNGKSYLLDFAPVKSNEILAQISEMQLPLLQYIQLDSPRAYFATYNEFTSAWINGKLSNFTYLMILNMLSGRSFNDVTQYPMFPLLYSDFESKKVRDLSKTLDFLEENKPLEFYDSIDFEIEQLFHPSPLTPDAVDKYMVRIDPFTTIHLYKQNCQFSTDKIFKDLSFSLLNKTELVPEFFFFPEFLTNINGLELKDFQFPSGITNPFEFVYQHRKLLESNEISKRLHQWINLIWGYKQKGKDAHDSLNYRHPFILENVWESEASFLIKADQQVSSMIHLYGSIPSQLFTEPHPIKEIHERNETELSIQEIHDVPFVFANNSNDDTILAVDFSKKVVNIKLKPNSPIQFEKEILKTCAKLTKDIRFCAIDCGMILISQDKEFLSILQSKGENESFKTFHFETTDVDYLRGSSNYFTVIRDRTIVTLFDTITFPEKVGQIVILDDTIVDCQINQNFSIIAILSRNGMLHLHSLNKMQKVQSVNLKPHHARKLLITPKWGFILVDCSDRILIFNINGSLIKEVAFKFDISNWTSFGSVKDFDYVIFETEKNSSIGIFEAFDPLPTLNVITQLPSPVKFMGYSRTQDCAYALTMQGHLAMISHPIPNT
ncbi:hypothetical protein TRFO_13208 [Tritrichomonas foetus]|uniref:BEACH domain-containing protein n=1 Tax=Tritrichomonas foetus TaxID=1144522 RepID=A0A1J4KZS4_9EUKA|nr:hypothetical protein TRFO_13208 [Tritrichomonas foetus]|eukprot:OHT16368.1 hypothetical protein TRFO_13208 [Tritrichomonas foetus]